MNRSLLLTALLTLGIPLAGMAQEQSAPPDPMPPPPPANPTQPVPPTETSPMPEERTDMPPTDPTDPARTDTVRETVPATPATPAVPATPAAPTSPAVPATSATPATPASPAQLPGRTVTAEASATTGQADVRDASGNPATVVSHPPVPRPRDPRADFDQFDANRDGKLTRREAAGDKYLLRTFRKLDANGDGSLDFTEAQAWFDD